MIIELGARELNLVEEVLQFYIDSLDECLEPDDLKGRAHMLAVTAVKDKYTAAFVRELHKGV